MNPHVHVKHQTHETLPVYGGRIRSILVGILLPITRFCPTQCRLLILYAVETISNYLSPQDNLVRRDGRQTGQVTTSQQ
jgi:hypothetical protein